MLVAQRIPLFENLSQFDFGDGFIDFHNDFNCTKVKFESNILTLTFAAINSQDQVSVEFYGVLLTCFDFCFIDSSDAGTIDTLYRGRFEINNTLIEFEKGKGYFYLEFYEGQRLEFWSEGLKIEK